MEIHRTDEAPTVFYTLYVRHMSAREQPDCNIGATSEELAIRAAINILNTEYGTVVGVTTAELRRTMPEPGRKVEPIPFVRYFVNDWRQGQFPQHPVSAPAATRLTDEELARLLLIARSHYSDWHTERIPTTPWTQVRDAKGRIVMSNEPYYPPPVLVSDMSLCVEAANHLARLVDELWAHRNQRPKELCKVYVVEYGDGYGHGGIDGIFATAELAEKRAAELRAEGPLTSIDEMEVIGFPEEEE